MLMLKIIDEWYDNKTNVAFINGLSQKTQTGCNVWNIEPLGGFDIGYYVKLEFSAIMNMHSKKYTSDLD